MFISSYVFAPVEQFLFVGLSNGKLYYWKKKNMEQKYLVDKGKDPELVELDAPASQIHKGDVKCLIYAKIEGLTRPVLLSWRRSGISHPLCEMPDLCQDRRTGRVSLWQCRSNNQTLGA